MARLINRNIVLRSWPRCIYGSNEKIMTVEHLIPKYWLKYVDAPKEAYNDYIHLFPAGKYTNMIRGHHPVTEIVPPLHRGVIARSLMNMRSKYPDLDEIMDQVLPYKTYVNWLQYPMCYYEKQRYTIINTY